MGYKACLVPPLYPFANGWALVSIGLLLVITNDSCVYIGHVRAPGKGNQFGTRKGNNNRRVPLVEDLGTRVATWNKSQYVALLKKHKAILHINVDEDQEIF
jgi:hypothetical protein